MIRAHVAGQTDRRSTPVVLDEAPMLVVDDRSESLRNIGATLLTFHYGRSMRDPWQLVMVEVRGTYLMRQDGAWVNSGLTVVDTFHAPGRQWYQYALADLPRWVLDMAATFTPPAQAVATTYTAEE